jgi:hypothetical protein
MASRQLAAGGRPNILSSQTTSGIAVSVEPSSGNAALVAAFVDSEVLVMVGIKEEFNPSIKLFGT